MRTYSFYCVLFFLLCSRLHGQLLISGHVLDKDTHHSLEGTIVFYNNRSAQAVCDSLGAFTLRLSSENDTLVFRHQGFLVQKFFANAATASSPLKISLTDQLVQLEEVSVTAGTLSRLIENKSIYLVDYQVLPGSLFLLMSYNSMKAEFDVSLVDASQKLLCRKTIYNEDARRIVKDCLGNLHIVSNHFARQVVFNTNIYFSLLDSVSNIQFLNTVESCVARVDSEIFMSESTVTRSLLYRARDKKRLPVISVSYDKEMTSDFVNKAFLKPVYAPVFVKNDTVVLFNFPAMEIDYFDKHGICIYKTPLQDFSQYHNYEIKYDEVTQKFYLYQRRNHTDKYFLTEIKLLSGKFGKSYLLERPFLHCMKVYDGDIYYIIREHQSWDDTAYLYKQKMQ